MPLESTNTELVPCNISTCWQMTDFTCEDLHVFHTDPCGFQHPLDGILSWTDFVNNTVFYRAVVAEHCDGL